MSTNSIPWIRALRDYHDNTPELLTPFCTSLQKQLGIDPDVPGGSSPIGSAIYNGQIADVNGDILNMQNSTSTSLTSKLNADVSTLLHSTDLIVGFIDSTNNQKFPGNLDKITTILGRFGLKPATHGNPQQHKFNVLTTDSGSATLQAPVTGVGSVYHWRWSKDQNIWIQVKSTHKSTVIINNLPQDVRVYFQYDFTPPIGKSVYPTVSANADDFHWSDSISELIPS
jgi:hypothetical protein